MEAFPFFFHLRLLQQQQPKQRHKVRRSRTIHSISQDLLTRSQAQLQLPGRTADSRRSQQLMAPITDPNKPHLPHSNSLNSFQWLHCKVSVAYDQAEQDCKMHRMLYLFQMQTKRPSFTWIQYQSPRKGLMTVLVLFGSHLLTWTPFAVRATMQALRMGGTLPPW